MEKKKVDMGLSFKPKVPGKGFLKEFVRVTESNKNNAFVTGRIVYIIKSVYGKVQSKASIFEEDEYDFDKPLKNDLVGFVSVRPQTMQVGYWNIPNFPWDLKHPYVNGKSHWKAYFDSELVRGDDFGVSVTLNDDIKNKMIYIKPSDPILKYYHNLK